VLSAGIAWRRDGRGAILRARVTTAKVSTKSERWSMSRVACGQSAKRDRARRSVVGAQRCESATCMCATWGRCERPPRERWPSLPQTSLFYSLPTSVSFSKNFYHILQCQRDYLVLMAHIGRILLTPLRLAHESCEDLTRAPASRPVRDVILYKEQSV
jgi:hypothetical protein